MRYEHLSHLTLETRTKAYPKKLSFFKNLNTKGFSFQRRAFRRSLNNLIYSRINFKFKTLRLTINYKDNIYKNKPKIKWREKSKNPSIENINEKVLKKLTPLLLTNLTSSESTNKPLKEAGSVDLPKDFITLSRFDLNFIVREPMYTKLKYSRSPAYDIVSGGAAAFLAAFIGFLISEKFGIELVDSGDFYTAFMYAVFLGLSVKPLLRITSFDKNLASVIVNSLRNYFGILTLLLKTPGDFTTKRLTIQAFLLMAASFIIFAFYTLMF